MTEADLGIKSIPRNPLLFGMLFRMEAVEHIGSGIKRIRDQCREYGVAEPRIEVSEHWFTVTFPRPLGQDEKQTSSEAEPLGTISVPSLSQVCPKSVPRDLAEMIMQALISPVDMLTIMALAGHTNRTRFRKTILRPLIDANLMELTIPDKPRSRNQRYRLTELGQEVLKRESKNRT